jgi:hypothetical protein
MTYRERNKARPRRIARPTTPPTTLPAIAPACGVEFTLEVVEVSSIELLTGNGEVGVVIAFVLVIAEAVVVEAVTVEDIAEFVGSDCWEMEEEIEISEGEVLKGIVIVTVWIYALFREKVSPDQYLQ